MNTTNHQWMPVATNLDHSDEWVNFLTDLLTKMGPKVVNEGQREGQAFMNALHDSRPDLYNILTGHINDPFYRDNKLPEAITTIYDHFVLTLP